MKGKEIISYIHRDKMPDIEQVRENCHRQYVSRNRKKRLRLSTAVAAMVVCLLLSGIAYAVVDYVSERLDIGGSYEFVIVPDDFYEREGTISLQYLYISGQPAEQQPQFDAKTAKILNELLSNKFFTVDGATFELIVPVSGLFSKKYRADDKGNVLYNSDGYEIGSILFESAIGSDPHSIHIWTKEEVEKQLGYNSTHEEAVSLLGKDFRLPIIYTEGLEPPVFQLTDIEEAFIINNENQELLPYEVKRVQVWFGGTPGMSFTIERIRSENNVTTPWHIPGGVIEEFEISGTKIYKISANFGDGFYLWVHDGLIYMFHRVDLPDAFTEEQCEEIIASMIE